MFDKPRNPEEAIYSFWDLSRAYQAPAVVGAAVELGVFAALAKKPLTPTQLAKQTRSSLRGTEMLCSSLLVMNYLKRTGTRYQLLKIWKPLLDPRSRTYIGSRVQHAKHSMNRWGRLAESIRSGKPIEEADSEKGATHTFASLVPALFALNSPDAQRAARLMGISRARAPYRVLDLAAGSAVWGIAAAQANPRVHVTAVDFPKILSIAKQFVKREKVARQFDFLGQDLRTIRPKKQSVDLAILGLVCHQFSEKENHELFSLLYESLKPGGKILIVEFAPYDDHSGPVYPVLFAMNMLLSTHRGDAYTRGEYCAWLDKAGFRKFRVHDMPSGITFIVAQK